MTTRMPNSKPAVRVPVGAASALILPAVAQRYPTWILSVGAEPVYVQNRLPATVAGGFPLAVGSAKLINSVEAVYGISSGGGGIVAVWEDEGEYVGPGGGGGGGGSASGLEADTHYSVSRKDFTAALKPATTDTLVLVFPVGFFTVDDENIETVTVRIADGHEVVYDPENYPFIWNAGAGELRVVGATFGVTDLDYDVDLLGPPRVPAKRADAAPGIATAVLPVQHIGRDGAAQPSGASAAQSIYTNSGAAEVAQATHVTPANFTAAFNSNVSVLCAGSSFVIDEANCRVVYLFYRPVASGIWSAPLINGINGVSLVAAANVITVSGAGTPFVAGDEYWIGVQQRPASGGGGGAAGGGDSLYIAPQDFTVTRTSATQLTLTGLSYTPTLAQFVSVYYVDVLGVSKSLSPSTNAFAWDPVTGVLTVTGATFAATDDYLVMIFGPDKSYSQAANAKRMYEIDPLDGKVAEDSAYDSTNLAATTNVPSDDGLLMYGFRDFSVTGKMIDADATITVKVYGTNDEDPVPANRDWTQLYGYRSDTNTIVNVITCASTTTTFSWDFDNLNYKYVRIELNPGGGATNTFIIKVRRKAL
jgi:hypothetical protein